jgi:hypothetical protein
VVSHSTLSERRGFSIEVFMLLIRNICPAGSNISPFWVVSP